VSIPGLAPEEAVKVIDHNGERSFKITDYKGRYVVLLFYTGDWECRENILAFQQLKHKYAEAGCEVFACSTDSTKVHNSWIKTSSADGGFGGSIKIPLISDCSGAMSKKYDVYDCEEGICRNAVVIIDDSSVVRHAMTTSMEYAETASNCLDIVAMLKQHKLSDNEVRNINSQARSTTKSRAKSSARKREVSPVKLSREQIESAWDVSTDPELNKVLNIAKLLGKTPPPAVVQVKKAPKFDLSTDDILRLPNPKFELKSCRVSLKRNLSGYPAQRLSKTQRTEIEALVEKMMGVAFMPEELTGQYHSLYHYNQREQLRLFEEQVFFNSGDIRLREPGAVTWSEGSGVFICNYQNMLIFVNEKEQLRVTCLDQGTDIRTALLRLKRTVESIEEAIQSLAKKTFLTRDGKFVFSESGVLAQGFDLSFIVELPGWSAKGEKTLKSTGIKQGLNVQRYGRKENCFEIRVAMRTDDDISSVIRRGIKGIDALSQEDKTLRQKTPK